MRRRSGRLSAARRCVVIAVLAAASVVGGCRGYSPDSLFRPDIRTVHIRVFDNKTFWRGYEVGLTRAVENEIKMRTPLLREGRFELAPSSPADQANVECLSRHFVRRDGDAEPARDRIRRLNRERRRALPVGGPADGRRHRGAADGERVGQGRLGDR